MFKSADETTLEMKVYDSSTKRFYEIVEREGTTAKAIESMIIAYNFMFRSDAEVNAYLKSKGAENYLEELGIEGDDV